MAKGLRPRLLSGAGADGFCCQMGEQHGMNVEWLYHCIKRELHFRAFSCNFWTQVLDAKEPSCNV